MRTDDASAGATPFPEARARIGRRVALQRLGIASGAALFEGCVPLRMALGLYPRTAPQASERVLRAFVEAVIPGAPREDPNLVRVFFDDYYPFAPYRSWLVWDLDRRARTLFDGRPCADLDVEGRTRVIEDALEGGGDTTARVYGGAIFLAQVAFYAGIYDDEAGCPLIDFQGASGLLPPEEQTYPVPGRYLAAAATPGGNPP